MSPKDFVYWLNGFIELSKASPDRCCPVPSEQQWSMIKAHLAMVLTNQANTVEPTTTPQFTPTTGQPQFIC